MDENTAYVIQALDALMAEPPTAISKLQRGDRPSVLSILGEAGSGKSTLLRSVFDSLNCDSGRLVLQPVSPERFAHGDTLFGWVLAELRRTLAGEHHEQVADVDLGDRRVPMPAMLELLSRREALARSDFKERPPSGVLTPDEWARALAAVTTAGLDLMHDWHVVLDHLTRATDDRAAVRQVVVTIDDADQVPAVLPGLLRDLRIIASHPAVAVVLCANGETITEALVSAPEFARVPANVRRRQVAAVLLKALPRHLRLELTPFSPEDRLQFRPFGFDTPIEAVLGRFRLPQPWTLGLASLADFFRIRVGTEVVASFYAEMLPALPRQLEHLWHELNGLADRQRELGPMAGEAARLLIQRATQEDSSGLGPDDDSTISFMNRGGRLALEVNFARLAFGQRRGGGASVFRQGGESVGVRRVDELWARHARGDDSDEISEDSVDDLLSPGATAAHYFARDVSDSVCLRVPAIKLDGYYGQPPMGGARNWMGMHVTLNREPTDHYYLLIPAWDSAYDLALYIAGWTELVEQVSRLGSDSTEAEMDVREQILLAHMTLVSAVQDERHADINAWPSLDEPVDEDQRIRILANLERTFGELYDGRTDWPLQRTLDFRTWLSIYLPWSTDALVCPPDLADAVIELRKRVLQPRGHLEIANEQCASALSSRVMANITTDWVHSAIDVIERFDSDQAQQLRQAQAIARTQGSQVQDSFARALEERGIPRGMIGEMRLHGLTPALEQRLRDFGLTPDIVQALRHRFPPVATEGTPYSELTADHPKLEP